MGGVLVTSPQPGPYPPGMQPPGLYPPGMYPPGMYPPGHIPGFHIPGTTVPIGAVAQPPLRPNPPGAARQDAYLGGVGAPPLRNNPPSPTTAAQPASAVGQVQRPVRLPNASVARNSRWGSDRVAWLLGTIVAAVAPMLFFYPQYERNPNPSGIVLLLNFLYGPWLICVLGYGLYRTLRRRRP